MDCLCQVYYGLCVIDVGTERVLDLSQPLHSQIVCRTVGKRPAVYLRYEEPNPVGGFIRIYPKGLRYSFTALFFSSFVDLFLTSFAFCRTLFAICKFTGCILGYFF